MTITVGQVCFFLAVIICAALGLDLWNPTGDIDWPIIALGLIALGLLLNGVTIIKKVLVAQS